MTIGSKTSTNGIHFKDPWQFLPFAVTATNLRVQDSASTAQDSPAVAFFTEMARRGLQDTTNWASDTYKTLLTVSSGKGFVAALVGPTAGGSETTTFEITNDGVLTEIAVPVSSGQRAALLAKTVTNSEFTTSSVFTDPGAEALASSKSSFSQGYATNTYIPPWRSMTGFPLLIFRQSLLIRAKHSASITNSTATAYSAVMYRLGL